jgi:hypothetical protein
MVQPKTFKNELPIGSRCEWYDHPPRFFCCILCKMTVTPKVMNVASSWSKTTTYPIKNFLHKKKFWLVSMRSLYLL